MMKPAVMWAIGNLLRGGTPALAAAIALGAGLATANPATANTATATTGQVSTITVFPTARPLPGLTAREANANAVWTMRAGLNVAALQCQFSPFLATVPTYNALLRQHSDELADAFKVMTGYFVRLQGPRAGQRAFDSYATRTNQNWATFDAQYSFCGAAAMTGRQALYVPKGKFGEFAAAELARLQTSLNGTSFSQALAPRLEWASVPTLTDPCTNPRARGCR